MKLYVLSVVLMTLLATTLARAEALRPKFQEILSGDIPTVQNELQKIVGKPVKIDVVWPSFDSTKENGEQELGANIQMLPRAFKKLMADKATGERIKKHVSGFVFRHSPIEAKPAVTFLGGSLRLSGNYEAMAWDPQTNFADMILKVLPK